MHTPRQVVAWIDREIAWHQHMQVQHQRAKAAGGFTGTTGYVMTRARSALIAELLDQRQFFASAMFPDAEYPSPEKLRAVATKGSG